MIGATRTDSLIVLIVVLLLALLVLDLFAIHRSIALTNDLPRTEVKSQGPAYMPSSLVYLSFPNILNLVEPAATRMCPNLSCPQVLRIPKGDNVQVVAITADHKWLGIKRDRLPLLVWLYRSELSYE